MNKAGRLILVFGSLSVLAAACSGREAQSAAPAATSSGMGAIVQSAEYAPLVMGFYQGEQVLFIHTEASDANAAEMLTRMMGPKVVLVPKLAQLPASVLADVYVFTNGVSGEGPFGYQPDVFDAVPGGEGYSPLRSVNIVRWADGTDPRELRSVANIQAAQAEGEVLIEAPGIVVNMPILVWPGGHR